MKATLFAAVTVAVMAVISAGNAKAASLLIYVGNSTLASVNSNQPNTHYPTTTTQVGGGWSALMNIGFNNGTLVNQDAFIFRFEMEVVKNGNQGTNPVSTFTLSLVDMFNSSNVTYNTAPVGNIITPTEVGKEYETATTIGYSFAFRYPAFIPDSPNPIGFAFRIESSSSVPITLANGDSPTFISIPEPSAALFGSLGLLASLRRRK